MNDKVLLLASGIRRDLEVIATVYEELDRLPLQTDADDDTLIVIAYRLHGLYNAFENIFQNVAAVFENSVDEVGRWRVQLLERMRLEVMPLRPAVIDDAAYEALDELRRFRRLFRHAYGVKLDAERLLLVMRKAFVLRTMYVGQLQRFVDFLQSLV